MRKRLLLLLTILLFIYLFSPYKSNSITTFSVSSASSDDLKNELITAFFINDIDSAVQNYYSDYFSVPLEVYNYETEIKNVSKKNNIISIRFGTTPQIGAHNPVGYDEIIFNIDNRGQREQVSYEHITTYALDKRFNNYIKMPLP